MLHATDFSRPSPSRADNPGVPLLELRLRRATGGAVGIVLRTRGLTLLQHNTIAFSAPDLTERERRYLCEAFDSTWISSLGPFVGRFEQQFAAWVCTNHAASCSNGTAALHLAMLSLGIGPGDEVIVPSMTYVATANAVRYTGADVVFADCDPYTWTIDADSVERMMSDRTRAMVAVHLLGVPCDMPRLKRIAEQRDVAIVEDAAEAHGTKLNGKPIGSWGDLSTFSFYGNKIITTGEGGMVCTDRADLADRITCLRGQGAHPDKTYWFDQVGYNYRLSNLACAIGLAQLERVDAMIEQRRRVAGWYDEAIATRGLPLTRQAEPDGSECVPWTCGIVLDDDASLTSEGVRQSLAQDGVETRPFFHPLSDLPMYRTARSDNCDASWRLRKRGILLPLHTQMSDGDVEQVVGALARSARVRESVA